MDNGAEVLEGLVREAMTEPAASLQGKLVNDLGLVIVRHLEVDRDTFLRACAIAAAAYY